MANNAMSELESMKAFGGIATTRQSKEESVTSPASAKEKKSAEVSKATVAKKEVPVKAVKEVKEAAPKEPAKPSRASKVTKEDTASSTLESIFNNKTARKSVKVSILLSEDAYDNAIKWKDKFGSRSFNSFINTLCENLDVILGENK